MKSVQALIATTYGNFFKANKTCKYEHLVIDQAESAFFEPDRPNYYWLDLFGLSKSRNFALSVATGEYCLVADDDVTFIDNVEQYIIDAFEKTGADILTFQIKTPGGNYFKNYSSKPFKHTKMSLMRVSSIEIVFNRDSISRSGLLFDERFGLGALFPTGEETIFLCDALDKGMSICYIPMPIVIHPAESSGGNFHQNTRLIESKGAMFYRIYGAYAYIIAILFSLKKYHLSGFSFIKFYFSMLAGISNFKK